LPVLTLISSQGTSLQHGLKAGCEHQHAGCRLAPGTLAVMPSLETEIWLPREQESTAESSPQRAASLTCVPSSGTDCLSRNGPRQTFVGAWHGALPAGCSVALDRLINSLRWDYIPGGAGWLNMTLLAQTGFLGRCVLFPVGRTGIEKMMLGLRHNVLGGRKAGCVFLLSVLILEV